VKLTVGSIKNICHIYKAVHTWMTAALAVEFFSLRKDFPGVSV
jgi:hypothetical protein